MTGPPTSTPSAAAPGDATALDALATVAVKGRAPRTGYARERFGAAWSDVDHNGCDTRDDVLRRDLTDVVPASGCVITSGTLRDPYTGATIAYARGATTSTRVQIDHLVALGDAWQKGAQQLSAARRLALANDRLNLLAVDGPTNGAKGDGDAATWLPPAKAFRCAYVAGQVAVKSRYGLWVTPAEKAAIIGVLAACPTQRVPDDKGPGPAAAGPTPSPPRVSTGPRPAAPTPVTTGPAPAAHLAPSTGLRNTGARVGAEIDLGSRQARAGSVVMWR
jgi:hypothetical protein